MEQKENIETTNCKLEEKLEIYENILTTSLLATNKEMDKIPLLERHEEEEIAKKIEEGDERYKNYFLIANLRLSRKIAYNIYSSTSEFHNFDKDDLMQEGTLGLIKAIEKFDYTKGCKFSTYATFWINHSIFRAINNNGNTIRLPIYVREKLNQFRVKIDSLQLELGYVPKELEIAQNLELSQYEVQGFLSRIDKTVLSLDQTIRPQDSSEADDSVIATLKDENALDPEAESIKKIQAQEIQKILTKLTPKQKDIISKRFGIGGKKPKTLHETGQDLGLTRERIRQIEKKALKRLKSLMEAEEVLNRLKI